jgi:hypothetical protein
VTTTRSPKSALLLDETLRLRDYASSSRECHDKSESEDRSSREWQDKSEEQEFVATKSFNVNERRIQCRSISLSDWSSGFSGLAYCLAIPGKTG